MNDPIADAVISDFGGKVNSLPASQRIDYIECTLCMCIELMRSAGDEYVRGFLEGALADLDKPTFIGGSIQ